MKKTLSYILTVGMLLTLLSGCSIPTNTLSSYEIKSSSITSIASSIIESSNTQSSSAATTTLSSITTVSKVVTKVPDTTTGKTLTVSYIDVGQADSILIQSPSGRNMLIDAGNSTNQTTIANYLKSKNIKKIDVLVATHPHADHIGGMAYIISNFQIGLIYMPKATTTTLTYEKLLTTIKNKGLSINTAKAGVVIPMGDSALGINMIAPCGSSYSDLNSYSAVIKIVYKNTSFLFAGDANNDSEAEMIASGVSLKADVLKVGHHGSATSSSAAFLKAVTPKYAVISVGKDNTYGHPTQATLDRLSNSEAKIYRTDSGGTVIITSNGQIITVNRATSVQVTRTPPPTHTVVAPTKSVSSTSEDITVFKTASGSKYHLDGCSYLSNSKIPIKLSAAKAEDLTACSRCNPPD